MNKSLIFLNGKKPTRFPNTQPYDFVIAADGALEYLPEEDFRISYCIGDMDSSEAARMPEVPRIKIDNQDRTDFDKILDFLIEKGVDKADVYGASGKEQDHFLGNLSSALSVKNRIRLTFYDEHFRYFLAKEFNHLQTKKGRNISLLPFPKCEIGRAKGLQYDPSNLVLELGKQVGTRNKTTQEEIEIEVRSGDCWIFVQID